MRITVTAVSEDSPPVVAFETPIGGGTGCWFAERPTPGQSYFVEFDVEEELTWGQQIVPTSSDEISLSTTDGWVRFRARCESDHDGVVLLSLGGSLVMLDVADVPAGLPAGTSVELTLDGRTIRLFPYQL